jgi:hypothetical protein
MRRFLHLFGHRWMCMEWLTNTRGMMTHKTRTCSVCGRRERSNYQGLEWLAWYEVKARGSAWREYVKSEVAAGTYFDGPADGETRTR